MGALTGQEMQRRRKLAGLSQSELAREFGVHVRTISKWERGILTVPEWVDLALAGLERRRPTAEEGTDAG